MLDVNEPQVPQKEQGAYQNHEKTHERPAKAVPPAAPRVLREFRGFRLNACVVHRLILFRKRC